jgi:hypothetical protein
MRRPVVFQLRYTSSSNSDTIHFDGQLVAFNDLNNYFNHQPYSSSPIFVTITSKNYTLEMDVVDIPGLTSSSVEGGTYLQRNRQIVQQYMTGNECYISPLFLFRRRHMLNCWLA